MGIRMPLSHPIKGFLRILAILIMVGAVARQTSAARSVNGATPCGSVAGDTLHPGDGEDLEVTTGICIVNAGPYHYGNVNIYNGGILKFADAQIDFWAKSILIENNGKLQAGVDNPIGTVGRGPNNTSSHVLAIHLYGPEDSNPRHGVGITCKTDAHCGIPDDIWNPNGSSEVTMSNGVTDFFYNYDSMPYDDGFESIGHGYYLEDGTETNNKLYANSAFSRAPQLIMPRTRDRSRGF